MRGPQAAAVLGDRLFVLEVQGPGVCIVRQ